MSHRYNTLNFLSANVSATEHRGNPLNFLSANLADISNRVNPLQNYDRKYDRIMCDNQCGRYAPKGITYFLYIVLDKACREKTLAKLLIVNIISKALRKNLMKNM